MHRLSGRPSWRCGTAWPMRGVWRLVCTAYRAPWWPTCWWAWWCCVGSTLATSTPPWRSSHWASSSAPWPLSRWNLLRGRLASRLLPRSRSSSSSSSGRVWTAAARPRWPSVWRCWRWRCCWPPGWASSRRCSTATTADTRSRRSSLRWEGEEMRRREIQIGQVCIMHCCSVIVSCYWSSLPTLRPLFLPPPLPLLALGSKYDPGCRLWWPICVCVCQQCQHTLPLFVPLFVSCDDRSVSVCALWWPVCVCLCPVMTGLCLFVPCDDRSVSVCALWWPVCVCLCPVMTDLCLFVSTRCRCRCLCRWCRTFCTTRSCSDSRRRCRCCCRWPCPNYGSFLAVMSSLSIL